MPPTSGVGSPGVYTELSPPVSRHLRMRHVASFTAIFGHVTFARFTRQNTKKWYKQEVFSRKSATFATKHVDSASLACLLNSPLFVYHLGEVNVSVLVSRWLSLYRFFVCI